MSANRPNVAVGQTWRSKANGGSIKVLNDTENTQQWIIGNGIGTTAEQIHANYWLADEGAGDWGVKRITDDPAPPLQFLQPSGGWGTLANPARFRTKENAAEARPIDGEADFEVCTLV